VQVLHAAWLAASPARTLSEGSAVTLGNRMNTGDAVWASARVRSLLRARDVGGMIRFARQVRGWRQDDLAAAAGYSRSTISRLETGAKAGTDVGMIRGVAAAAGIPSLLLSELLGITAPPAATVGTSIATRTDGGDDPVRRRQLIAAGLAIPLSVLASLDDALALLPSPASAATAPEITARLERARKCFDASDLARLIAGLPGLIAAAHQAAENGTDPAGWGRVGACYDLATETLNKIGSYGSSRVTADRATTYAALSGSPIAMSAAARSLGIVLRHEGRHAIADQVTLQAASRLETTGLTTPAQFAAFSQMLCTCAYNAAQAGDRDRALELITDAERAAARLPPHAVPGQPFTVTPAQVALYKVGVHWSLGDAGTAIAAGRDLRPAQFPTAERRGRLHTDLARAWWQWGKPEPTARELLAALRQAPGEVRDRPSIRKVAVSLIQQHPRVPGVRELAAAIGRPESGDHLVRRQ
jgi:transcriptional regulator with XRE-family HTH domain